MKKTLNSITRIFFEWMNMKKKKKAEMNFPILLFSFECGASNAPNLNIVAFFISVLQLFPYKKNIYIYQYLSIEYFLRFFVSYLTRNNLKRLISCINITSIIFSFPPPITIRSNDFRQKCASSCGAKWTKPLAWATGHRAPMERNAARKRFVFFHLSIC